MELRGAGRWGVELGMLFCACLRARALMREVMISPVLELAGLVNTIALVSPIVKEMVVAKISLPDPIAETRGEEGDRWNGIIC